MATTIFNQGSSTYQFEGTSETLTTSSNENQITLENGSGLVVSKTANPTTFVAGDIITYTIQITNNTGQFLNGVRVIDSLANSNLAYVLGSANLTVGTLTYPVAPVATSPLTFTLQQLNVGQSMTLTYDAQVIFNLPPSFQTLTNSVEAIGYTATGTVQGFDNNTIQKKTNGDVSITKSASDTNVFPLQVFDYYLTFSNNTSSNVVNAIISDQLPSNFVLESVFARINQNPVVELSLSDYSVTGTNLLEISSILGGSINVPASSSILFTLRGYLT